MIRSSIQVVKEEPFFMKDLISFKAVHYFPFGSPLTMIGIKSKRSTSENKGSNVLFGIIK